MSEDSPPLKPPYTDKKRETESLEERRDVDEYPPKPGRPSAPPSERPVIPVPVPISEELPKKEIEEESTPQIIEYSQVSYEEQKKTPVSSEDLAMDDEEGQKKRISKIQEDIDKLSIYL